MVYVPKLINLKLTTYIFKQKYRTKLRIKQLYAECRLQRFLIVKTLRVQICRGTNNRKFLILGSSYSYTTCHKASTALYQEIQAIFQTGQVTG